MSLTPTAYDEMMSFMGEIERLKKENDFLKERLMPLYDAAIKYYALWKPDRKDEDELHAAFSDLMEVIGGLVNK